MKYYKAFEESGYHTVFLTTFTFGTQAFEDMVLQRLRNAGCNNIHVFADQNMINQEFSLFGPPRNAGTAYHLIKCTRNGAFHPKLVLQLGVKKARILLGSANLTAPGLAGNLELVSEIRCSGAEDPSVGLIAEALKYVIGINSQADPWFKQCIVQARQRTPWLDINNASATYEDPRFGRTSFIHDASNVTPLDQFADLIGDDPIKRLNIISPYWDKQLEALKRLSVSLNHPKIRVAIQKDRQLFPKEKAEKIPNIRVYNLDDFCNTRRVHSKLMIAEGSQYDHVLAGSMNCSRPAMMTSASNSLNAEAGLYRRFPKKKSIKHLGLKRCFKNAMKISDLPDYNDGSGDANEKELLRDGGTLVLNGNKISWTPSQSQPKNKVQVEIFSRESRTSSKIVPLIANPSSNTWTCTIPFKQQDVLYGHIIFDDGLRSHPVHISNLNILPFQSQPKAKRKIQKQLAALDLVQSEGLEIIEILYNLEQFEETNSTKKASKSDRKRKELEDPQTKNYSPLTYEAFLAGQIDHRNPAYSNGDTIFSGRFVSDVSRALNRILGIVTSQDTAIPEDGFVDLRPTERGDESDVDSDNFAPTPQATTLDARKVKITVTTRNTIENIVGAVRRLGETLSKKNDSALTLVQLIHIRALLQVILAFSIPVKYDKSPGKVLPPFDPLKKASGWPRLIGIVLTSFYRNDDNPLKNFILPDGTETIPYEIIDCLALIDVALGLAKSAASSFHETLFIAKKLDELHQKISTLTINNFEDFPEATARYERMKSDLLSRFEHLIV